MKFLKKITGEELSFANMIHSLRMSDEISQVELANMIGISKGIMCDIEKGRRLPTIDQAKNMAEALGYPIQGFIAILFQDQLKKANLKLTVSLDDAS
jgi:transcriptional regulator with XRE-family HTH domain